jgi:transposase
VSVLAGESQMRWARIPRFLLCTLGLQEEKGHPAQCPPQPWAQHHLMLSSITLEGMGTSLAVEGATNREVFETYVEQILAPTLRRGQVVVMDNLTAHKGDRVKELIEERGCKLIYLPPYSPDFNPIEEAFAKIKALVRKAEARTREALVEAIGRGISMVTAEDAQGFFDHCGYTTPVQLL